MMSDFFAMGGYAAFIWSSYAISALAMGLLVTTTLRSLRRNEKILARLQDSQSKKTADTENEA